MRVAKGKYSSPENTGRKNGEYKMKVKRGTAIVLLTAMVLGLAACTSMGGSSSAGSNESDSSQESSSAVQEEPQGTADASQQEEGNETDSVQLGFTDVFEQQNAIDEALQKEVENAYPFEEAAVIVDPYRTSPLTGVVIFHTDEEVGGTITVKGKAPEDDITGEIEPAKDHIIPVIGLYNGETTEIELALSDGRTRTVEVETEKQNLEFGEISAEMLDASVYDYEKLTFVFPFGDTMYAVDSAGDIRWCYSGGGTMGVHQLANGHLMVPMPYVLKSTYYKEGLQEIDFNGRIYAQYEVPGGQHHDFQELPDGNLLVASDAPDLSTVEDYVVELDRSTGEVVWELDMKDLLSQTDGMSSSMDTDGSEESDWLHNNSLWYDETNDLVLLSCRHKDAIIAIHKEEKTLAWILGDPDGWGETDSSLFFTPVGEDFEWQYAQHQVTILDNGDIMLFDNGTAKAKRGNTQDAVSGDAVYSRAVVYRLDTQAMTIEQVFEYGKERGAAWYSDWVSGSESLDGTADNLWITAGSHLFNPDENRHDYYPKDMMVPGLVKSTHIDQVVNGELAYEIVISGDTYLSLAFRSARIDPYTNGAFLDIETEPQSLGSLSETAYEQAEEDLSAAQRLNAKEWSFTVDNAKLFLSGTYSAAKVPEEVAQDYLILSNGEEQRKYLLTQYKTASEEGDSSTIAISGWAARTGLSGIWHLYLSLDGILYDTGYEINPNPGKTGKLEKDSLDPVGYYERELTAPLDMDDLLGISENDAVSSVYDSDIPAEESLVASSLAIDALVEEELNSGSYTWESPLAITDPYQNSPLAGLILFQTEQPCSVRVTVKGKTAAADIVSTLSPAAMHRVPVIGLYPGQDNTVILEMLDEKGDVSASQEISMYADELPESLQGMVEPITVTQEGAYGLTMVYGLSCSHPFAYDCNGDIRWYLDRKVENYGMYLLSDGHLIMQDGTGYTPNLEKPQSTNLYELDCLGRYYRMYYLANGSHHEVIEKTPGGNLLCLTSSLEDHYEDEIVEIDRKTGEIVNELELIDIFGDTYTDKLDWAHINTVSWQEEGDTILISCRNLHSVIKIGWTDHELVWILSDPRFWAGTDFEKYVLDPEGDFAWQYQQHSSYQLEQDLDGDPETVEISLFDNHTHNYRKLDFYDNLKDSYVKIFSVNEKERTVSLTKEIPVIRSTITSIAIYDEKSGHIFAMCGHIHNKTAKKENNGYRGMTYEFDYQSGDLLAQFAIKNKYYRAGGMILDPDDLAARMDAEGNYLKGTLKKPVQVQEAAKVPEKTASESDISLKRIGGVLYVSAKDHQISQVIFRGKQHTYVYDTASIVEYYKKYKNVVTAIAVPLQEMEADRYEIDCVFKNELVALDKYISVPVK